MFFILGFLLIPFVLAVVVRLDYSGYFWKAHNKSGYWTFSISMLCVWLVLLAIWGTSYESYLNMSAFYRGTCEQYSGAVKVYGDWAVIDIESATWTDFKYAGYQDNISGFVKELREKVSAYNEELVKKRAMKANSVFNWLIVSPDEDMLIMKMKDEVYPELKEPEKEE
jgi:hypothetical protein